MRLPEIWTSLTWQWGFGYRLKSISGNYRGAPKIVAKLKSAKKWLKNDLMATFNKVQRTSLTHFVFKKTILS